MHIVMQAAHAEGLMDAGPVSATVHACKTAAALLPSSKGFEPLTAHMSLTTQHPQAATL